MLPIVLLLWAVICLSHFAARVILLLISHQIARSFSLYVDSVACFGEALLRVHQSLVVIEICASLLLVTLVALVSFVFVTEHRPERIILADVDHLMSVHRLASACFFRLNVLVYFDRISCSSHSIFGDALESHLAREYTHCSIHDSKVLYRIGLTVALWHFHN
jgi:hypothetical protein